MTTGASKSGIVGALCGIAAAALFGMSAPLAKLLLVEASPLILAGLFYLGSGVLVTAYRLVRPSTVEARLSRADLPTLVSVMVLGGMLGPILMLWGLSRVSALSGSLLLNLEAPFTMIIAVLIFREHLSKQALLAAACILGGAGALKIESGVGTTASLGLLAIAGACLSWALDNNLTQRLSLKDPFAVVRFKALTAGLCNLGLGFSAGAAFPFWRVVLLALALGAVSYGASVVLDAYALRFVGAAREAAYFATAPFIGALLSVSLLGDTLHVRDAVALALMVVGVILMLRERHGHAHVHSELAHDHLHTHDEHHRHAHQPNDPPGDRHAHPHDHPPLTHDHPHVSDLHHRHRH